MGTWMSFRRLVTVSRGTRTTAARASRNGSFPPAQPMPSSWQTWTEMETSMSFPDQMAKIRLCGMRTMAVRALRNGSSPPRSIICTSIFAADLDGDGDIDVLGGGGHVLTWCENNGSQVFTERFISATLDGLSHVVAADVDRDGDMDVLSASWQRRHDRLVRKQRQPGLHAADHLH